jgi:uncharacterized protein (TIGR03437 family)
MGPVLSSGKKGRTMNYKLSILLALALAGRLAAQPTVNNILTPSLEPDFRLAPGAGGIVIVQGIGLAAQTRAALVPPLPLELAGAQVLIDNVKCPLLLVSPQTIHAQVPLVLTTEHPTASVYLTVKNEAGESAPLELKLQATHPFLVTRTRDGKGPALQLNKDLVPMNGAAEGDTVVLYATGLGKTAAAIPDDSGAARDPFPEVALQPEVWVGDARAEVLSAVLAPFPAVYMVSIKAPKGAGNTVRLVTEGTREHTAEWTVANPAAAKATDIVAQIDAPFPNLAKPSGWAPILVGVKCSLALTVTRQPEPFEISLGGDAAAVRITVTPADGTYQGTAVVPALMTRFGDFSQTDMKVIDLLLAGMPMPGNIVPMSRMPPEYGLAWQRLPQGNETLPGGANALLHFQGAIPENGRLIFDDSTVPGLAAAAWKAITDTRAASYTTRFQLSVDGVEVASREVGIPLR